MEQVVSSLSEEAVICLPKRKTVPGYQSSAMYFDHTANQWQTTGVTLMTVLPPECAGLDMFAMASSHFTEFSVFATTDYNECLYDTPCGDHSCQNTDGSFQCTCASGSTGQYPRCTFTAPRCTYAPCNGGTCDDSTTPLCSNCPQFQFGNFCEFHKGQFMFSSPVYSASESEGEIYVTIVRNNGHDGEPRRKHTALR
ncbi:neurogenic locus notch homolog protein 1-like [Haliotis asinina]|uniref:neurogenic locus notch homolog protein 1-like n=1 Tax=Haliotis asinina TaxID=109174 RepID=UPI003531A3D3